MQENKTASFFDRYSIDFNAIYGSGTGPFQRLINKWFRQTMLIRFQKTIVACNPLEGKTILDVGCGPGIYSITLAKGSPNFVYWGSFDVRCFVGICVQQRESDRFTNHSGRL